MTDLALVLKARELGAEEIASPRDEADLDRFLRELDERWITAVLDGRHIGLAIAPPPSGTPGMVTVTQTAAMRGT